MIIEQFVMAYGVDQDRLRALLPEGFQSLRPVLRINAEIRDGKTGYLELNTAVEKDGIRGWLNIAAWENVPFTREGKTTVFRPDHLEISFTGVGIRGGCPAEKDNAGCFFPGRTPPCAPARRSPPIRSSATAASAGAIPRAMPAVSASARPCPPSPRRPAPPILSRPSPPPTPPRFPASRSWAAIRCGLSGRGKTSSCKMTNALCAGPSSCPGPPWPMATSLLARRW